MTSTSFRDNVECTNGDLVYTALLSFIQFSTVNRTGEIENDRNDPTNKIFSDIWFLTVCRIYDEFFYPSFFPLIALLSPENRPLNSTKKEFLFSKHHQQVPKETTFQNIIL